MNYSVRENHELTQPGSGNISGKRQNKPGGTTKDYLRKDQSLCSLNFAVIKTISQNIYSITPVISENVCCLSESTNRRHTKDDNTPKKWLRNYPLATFFVSVFFASAAIFASDKSTTCCSDLWV
ncbi:hypothetical protein VQ7734_02866 [Vibrio quintilis]|uniref:Uncharacterized protein n=1 Tax=Vibrio quintilis TaxID=1117707 RepID=A0A1M7YWR2_9VIBR|nr:hypothetical protein VQ7734_02866 [Vibrio quintilis]